MPFITLCVTQAVLDQVTMGNQFQKQIAVHGASPEILNAMMGATSANQTQVNVNGSFPLRVGDRNAIWAVHQSPVQSADFEDLFSLLARRPDRDVTFTW
jgi:hypothetical protein